MPMSMPKTKRVQRMRRKRKRRKKKNTTATNEWRAKGEWTLKLNCNAQPQSDSNESYATASYNNKKFAAKATVLTQLKLVKCTMLCDACQCMCVCVCAFLCVSHANIYLQRKAKEKSCKIVISKHEFQACNGVKYKKKKLFPLFAEVCVIQIQGLPLKSLNKKCI